MRERCVEAVRELVITFGLGATARVIEQYRDGLYDPEALELLQLQLPRHEAHSREHQVIATRLRALERSIAEGDAATFEGYEAATDAILAVLNADDWEEVERAVQQHRHVLFPEVSDIAFADLLMQPGDDDVASQVAGGWALIRHCREAGVAAAIERQRAPRRGFVISADVASQLAAAESDEQVIERLEAVPEVAARIARRDEGARQLAQWPGLAAYNATVPSLAGPEMTERKIAICREALALIDREQLPIVWATVALDLADALRTRAGYSAPSPMSEVISLYREAAAHLSAEHEALTYAHAHAYLGDALMLDSEGEPDANIESAIGAFESALALYRPLVESAEWARVAAHLGEALLRRLHGDPSVDVDRAAVLLTQAVEILETSERGPLLASARLSLAMASLQRGAGSRDENLRRAARHLRNAAEGVNPDQNPDVWAMASAHLGSVYLERSRDNPHGRAELLEQAEACFRSTASRKDAAPTVRARAHAGLGWVLGDKGVPPDADEGPIAHLHHAIDLYQQLGAAFDRERASIHRNAGITFKDSSARLTPAVLARAEHHFRAALDLLPASSYAVDRRDTLRPFGQMLFEHERWAEALACFEQAMSLSEGVLAGRAAQRGKEKEVTANRGLYAPAAYCYAKLGRPGKALAALERGKARMLAEGFAVREAPEGGGTSREKHAMAWARSEIVRLEARNRQLSSSGDIEAQARIGRQLQDAYTHLATLRGVEVERARVEPDVEALVASIPPGGALVAVFATKLGGSALVIPAGAPGITAEHLVDLPSLDIAHVMEMMAGHGGEGGWLNAYLKWAAHSDEFDSFEFDSFRASFDVISRALGEHLMSPVEERLATLGISVGAPVVLLPSGWLSLLPLHLASGGANGGDETFGERFVVSYIPSLRAMETCRRRLAAPARRGRAALIVANPTGDLRHAAAEGVGIARLFENGSSGALPLEGSAATRSQVLAGMKGRQVLHFACHASFNWADAPDSGLHLANGERVLLYDLLSPEVDLGSARLVTLSACETGLSEFRNMPDEFVGLPGALLLAGAPAVVSSLWPVDEVATRLLMTEFYRLQLAGAPAAQALQGAQQWLKESTAAQLELVELYEEAYAASGETDAGSRRNARYHRAHADDTPFSHPYYWGAFVLTGADAVL